MFLVGSMLAGCEQLPVNESLALPVQAMPVTRASCEKGLVQEALTSLRDSVAEGAERRQLREIFNDDLEQVRSQFTPLGSVSTPKYQGLGSGLITATR